MRMVPPEADVPGFRQRTLYPDLKVVTEDYERDCFMVQVSRAKTSRSFDILSAFRRTKGGWIPNKAPSKLRPHSVELLQEQAVDRWSRSKTSVGSARHRLEVDAEAVIRPLTRAQVHAAASKAPGTTASVNTSISLSRSDARRPPSCVRGRTREKKQQLHEGPLQVAPAFEDFGLSQALQHGLRNCSYPGERDTMVMTRHESSMRHPEAYARWLGNLRQIMQEMNSRAAHSAPFKKSTAGQFHEQLQMLSEEVLAAVQLHLNYVRSEIAGLCCGAAMHVVGGASAVEGFPAKYGQRRLELAMLCKHLSDERWNLKDTVDLDCSAGAAGFAVWINGLTIKRFSLRHNAQVQRAILPFFSALRNPLGQVTKRQYLTFNAKVFRALLPVFDIQNAILLCEVGCADYDRLLAPLPAFAVMMTDAHALSFPYSPLAEVLCAECRRWIMFPSDCNIIRRTGASTARAAPILKSFSSTSSSFLHPCLSLQTTGANFQALSKWSRG